MWKSSDFSSLPFLFFPLFSFLSFPPFLSLPPAPLHFLIISFQFVQGLQKKTYLYFSTVWFSFIPLVTAAVAAKSLQSCPTLCDPIDGSPPGSPVPGIVQARTLEWVAISFSNAWKWKMKVKSLSCVRLLATPWTAVHQALLSMGFSRQECWSGVPWPSP